MLDASLQPTLHASRTAAESSACHSSRLLHHFLNKQAHPTKGSFSPQISLQSKQSGNGLLVQQSRGIRSLARQRGKQQNCCTARTPVCVSWVQGDFVGRVLQSDRRSGHLFLLVTPFLQKGIFQ